MRSLPVVSRSQKKRFWVFMALTVVGYFLIRLVSENLPGKTIIDFELAKTVERATQLMQEWGSEGRRLFLNSIYADFFFLVAYAGALFYGCRVTGSFSGHPIFEKAGNIFSFLALLAAVCDVLENTGMLITIKNTPRSWIVHFTYDMAFVKFSLLFICILFVVVCLLFRAIDLLNGGKKGFTL
jgi:hypothetical protein